MDRITLFHFESPEIKINIEAYFDEEMLIIEGYDIGKTVEAVWGDSDYEYSIAVQSEDVTKVYDLLEIEQGNKVQLLKAIADKFNSNTCFSDFSKFLEKNEIKSEGFSWT